MVHPIPDVPGFLNDLFIRQPPGGAFPHLQDPTADEEASGGAQLATAQFRRRNSGVGFRAALARMCPQRVAARIRYLTRHVLEHIAERHSIFMRQEIITKPMAAREIWSVTDKHAEDGRGASLRTLQLHVQTGRYRLIHGKPYEFLGPLQSELPTEPALNEAALIEAKA